jgi:hypothetical protein
MSESALDIGGDANAAPPAADSNQGVNEFALAARRLSVSKETVSAASRSCLFEGWCDRHDAKSLVFDVLGDQLMSPC